ncbi:MAG: hypothetical protein JWP01_2582 [Myxococcales bacterium]|nr:hypothetical protein [Myxococcales bacterium]
MPWRMARTIAEHLNKAEAARVAIKASSWHFVPHPEGVMVTAEQDGETFERLVIAGSSWVTAIDAAEH